MADRVELVYGDDRTGVKRASIRSNQCSTAFLKAFFQINTRAEIFLRDLDNSIIEGVNESGTYNVIGGRKYSVLVTEAPVEPATGTPIRLDHPYGFGQALTRPPQPNVAIGAGRFIPLSTTAPVRRSLPNEIPNLHSNLSVTKYFNIGRWSIDGQLIEIKPPITCPVSLLESYVVSLEAITAKLNISIKNVSELTGHLCEKYEIYRWDQTKLIDNEEIRSLKYWANEGKKKKFFAMPAVMRKFNWSDSDDDIDDGSNEKRKKQKNGKGTVKKLAVAVTASVESLMTKLTKEIVLKGLYSSLKSQFTCILCQDVISGKPAVCILCTIVVGCETCHKEYKKKEVRDNGQNDELSTNWVTKAANDWRCPNCRYLHHSWQEGDGFISIKSCDFLAELKQVEGMSTD